MRTQNRTNDHRPAPRRAHGLFSLILASLFGICAAAEPSIRFDQPAQPLAAALDAIARASGLKLLYADAAVRGRQAAALRGHYTTEEALRTVLGDSGLRYEFVGENMVAVKNGPESETPKTADVAPTALEEMTVTASPLADTSYNVPNGSTATKTDTPIMETPVSIQVVPRVIMDDQQAINLRDVLRNVSGVVLMPGNFGLYDSFTIRGISNGFGDSIYRNGVRYRRTAFETANLERVEVLKGPAAVLYGRTEPGGIINLVTKRPQAQPYYSLQQQFGSFDFYRTTAEATGSLTADGSLLYRADFAFQDNDSFRDFLHQRRTFFSPSLTWRPSERTEFNLSMEFNRKELPGDYGIPFIGTELAPIPFSRQLSDGNNRDMSQTYFVDFNFSHQLTDAWKITNYFTYYDEYFQWDNLYPESLQPGCDIARRTCLLNRAVYFVDDNRATYADTLDLTGKFDALGLHHTVLLGFDWYRNSERAVGIDSFGVRVPFAPPIDIFNPVYGISNRSLITPADFTSIGDSVDEWYGVYFQDQMNWSDKIHLLVGGRYDWTKMVSGFSATSLDTQTITTLTDEAFSPRTGIVYQPWPWASIYFSWSESFGSSVGDRSRAGKPFEPQTGEQFEGGVKTEVLDGRLASTLAVFDLTKGNLVIRDPNDPNFSIQLGEVKSRGVELDVSGKITDAWNVVGSFAYTDTEITRATDGTQGNRLPNAPLFSGSFWSHYRLTTGAFKGLGLGAGVFLVGERHVDSSNTLQIPGYGRVDALIDYQWKLGNSRLTVQFNINNLLDKAYIQASLFDVANELGAPRTFLGSIRMEF